jgi:hypothetical protein
MKSILFIFLTLGTKCFSQQDTGIRILVPIDYKKMNNFDFEKALERDKHKPPTPESKAGSLVLSAQLLCGGWQAEWMGNNWGGLNQTIVRPDKRIVFKDDSIFFYRKDTLERVTTYRLVKNPDTIYGHQTLITFGDSSEKWLIILIRYGSLVPWHGPATKLHLLFNKELNCLCGCPESLYSQEIPSSADNY